MQRSKKDTLVYRLVEYVALPVLLLSALIMTACSVTVGWGSSRSAHSSGYSSLTMTSGDEAFVVRREGSGKSCVAVYRKGQLYGVDGLSDAQRRQIRSFHSRRQDLVDHPKLQEWQTQLERMNKLADDADTTAQQLADAATGFPFDRAVDGIWMDFLGDDPKRAQSTLDVVDDLELRSSSLQEVVALAIRSEEVSDDQLAEWLGSAAIRDDKKSYEALATCPHIGPKSARKVIQKIDDIYGSTRAKAFEQAGRQLVARPGNARLVASSLDELYGSDRARVALTLLESGADAAFAIELLRNIDEFYGTERKRVYMAAGRRALSTDEGSELLVDNIDELYGTDRSQAAIKIVSWQETPKDVVLGYLRELDEFYGSHQERVLEAVIDSRHFADIKVQRACLRSARGELSSTRLTRVLNRMDKSPQLDGTVRGLIQKARED